MVTKVVKIIKLLLLSVFSLFIIVFPSPIKIPIYRFFCGYKFGKNVKIGLSWIHVTDLEIGDNVIIGHMNCFKHIPKVKIGNFCTIGNMNVFASSREFTCDGSISERGNFPLLIIGSHCGISSRHYFDIQDTFTIKSFTTIAGVNSVFFTHYIDFKKCRQSVKPISIGKYCMIGSNVSFIPGVIIPDCCIVGMGSVVTSKFEHSHMFIAGNPARILHELDEDASYFHRHIGYISSFMRPPFEIGI